MPGSTAGSAVMEAGADGGKARVDAADRLVAHHPVRIRRGIGEDAEEIADTLGTSVGTVKKTLFRVVDRLRQHFAMPAVKG